GARELSTPHANALTPVIARPTGRGTCRRPIVAYTNPSTWRSASRRAASETEWSRSERSMVITRWSSRAATIEAARASRPATGELAASSVMRPMVHERRGDGRPREPGTGSDVGSGGPERSSHLQDVRARRPAGSEPERLCLAGLYIDQRAT